MDLINKIKNSEIKLAEAKNDQIRFKSYLGETKKGSKKSKEQKKYNTQYWKTFQSKKQRY